MWETCPKLGSGWASAVDAEARAVGLLLFEWHQGQRGALWVPLAQECWGGSRGSARLGRDPRDLIPILRAGDAGSGWLQVPGEVRSSWGAAPGGLRGTAALVQADLLSTGTVARALCSSAGAGVPAGSFCAGRNMPRPFS